MFVIYELLEGVQVSLAVLAGEAIRNSSSPPSGLRAHTSTLSFEDTSEKYWGARAQHT